MKRIYSLHFPNFLLTIITRVFNDYILVGLTRVGLVYCTVQIVVGHDLKYCTQLLDLIVQLAPDCGGVGGPT